MYSNVLMLWNMSLNPKEQQTMTDRMKRRLQQIEDAIAQKEDASEMEFHIHFVNPHRTIASTLILRGNGEREIIPGRPEAERPED